MHKARWVFPILALFDLELLFMKGGPDDGS